MQVLYLFYQIRILGVKFSVKSRFNDKYIYMGNLNIMNMAFDVKSNI